MARFKLLGSKNKSLKTYFMSEEGMDKLKHKYEQLKARRIEASRTLSELNDQPNSNTAEDQIWTEAINTLQYVEREIESIEDILSRAKPIQNRKGQRVSLGSRVVLIARKQRVKYTIVGSLEANPLEGKISDESPFGRLLMGKKVGDTVTLPQKASRFKLLTFKLANIE